MMTLTQQFLRNGGTVEQLDERYAIGAKRHPQFPQLVMLKYSQINAPMAEPIVQECRGIILDEAADWAVVSFPYRKFFNHGEPNAHAIDWTTATAYEKLDGSLMTLYHYADQWRVASSGTPDAGGQAHTSGMTFADLFWRTWRELGYMLPTDTGCCYMFELMTPFNRVIVPHRQGRIVFHGCRELVDGFREIAVERNGENGWECVKSYPLTTADACVAAAEELNPLEGEGYVVRDASFNRLKIKSPAYVALAHLKNGCSPRRLLEIARKGESDEFLAHFPEWTAAYEVVRAAHRELCDAADYAYLQFKAIESQKEFAARACAVGGASSALFSIRAGKSRDARDFYATCSQPAIERIIGMDALCKRVTELVGMPAMV